MSGVDSTAEERKRKPRGPTRDKSERLQKRTEDYLEGLLWVLDEMGGREAIRDECMRDPKFYREVAMAVHKLGLKMADIWSARERNKMIALERQLAERSGKEQTIRMFIMKGLDDSKLPAELARLGDGSDPKAATFVPVGLYDETAAEEGEGQGDQDDGRQ